MRVGSPTAGAEDVGRTDDPQRAERRSHSCPGQATLVLVGFRSEGGLSKETVQ